MKVVFVHGRFVNSWEAQGLGFIGAYLKRHEPRLNLAFYQGCFDSDADILAGCADADIVGFSCTSPTMKHALFLAERIKAANSKTWTVFGGYHPSALPEATQVHPAVDQVVVGEGEAAMLGIVHGDRRPLLRGRRMAFDELPWVDRELIRNERTIDLAEKLTGQRITSFQGHRGCPHACRFCADGARKVLYGRAVCERAVDDLLDEIASVSAKYRLDLIKFSDPTWNVNTGFVRRFCERKVTRQISVPFFSYIHAAATSERMFEQMAEAGCQEIGLGIESGSDRVLKAVGKHTTTASIRRAVQMARTTPIRIRGFFILGTPEETEDDLRRTEGFAEELDLDEYGFSILCPYPGTDYHDSDPDQFAEVDWSVTDEYHNDFWKTRNLSPDRLRYWQERLCRKFGQRLTLRQRQLEARP